MIKTLVDLQGKCFLVTGASSGIGKATVRLLSELGAGVILLGRNEKKLLETLSQMSGAKRRHHIILFDLMNYDQLDSLLEGISSFAEQLDGVVHCSGAHIYEPFKLIDKHSIQNILQLNVMAPMFLTRGLYKDKLLRAKSSIVFLSSVSGFLGVAGASVYSTSKAAVIGLTKSLAIELAGDGVRVNSVVPAVVKTPMTDRMFEVIGAEHVRAIEKKHLFGFGEPDDIANMITFLLSDAAKWITGSCMVVDGGYSLDK